MVVPQSPTNPAGRLCDVIFWPGLPMVVMLLLLNPAATQVWVARRICVPIKLGTTHCVGVGVAVAVAVGVALGATVAVAVAVGVGLGATVAVAVAVGVGVGDGAPAVDCRS